MSDAQHPVAVIGATGQQGSRVVDALRAADQPVRALVRDPGSGRARALQDRGVEVVAADQEDPASLRAALTGVASLFLMTTFEGPDGPDGEVRRGAAVADAAAAAGVPRVVYSSVGGAERGTGIPHFESKRQVEQRLAAVLPATFLRPTFFMENLTGQLAGADGEELVLRLPLPGDVPLQMVAVRDIGTAAARLLVEPAAVEGDAVEIAGDELTMDEAAARVAAVRGRPARYEPLPLDVLGDDEDMRAMFAWFAAPPAYQADLGATRRLVPDVRDLGTWVGEQMAAARAAG
ncbi:NmrA/HSCARG family protein [Desertihabitans brevis]|uniref:NmrA/HSCARG family protein n=1 Tax=Desertihabitans brevis TaxID=2268447 RepID=A0A367YRG2_9ACTN|nr:NmrA/HSCARG family protein [Desertihabitans brevis]RCK68476.1 NmrA/HSCARG family protein [Desertihabitans brevis]